MITVTYTDGTEEKYQTFEDIKNHTLVTIIDCSYNQLTKLPENMNFPNLQVFHFSYNQITKLPENMNFPNLQKIGRAHV